jgi:hypothetical protein
MSPWIPQLAEFLFEATDHGKVFVDMYQRIAGGEKVEKVLAENAAGGLLTAALQRELDLAKIATLELELELEKADRQINAIVYGHPDAPPQTLPPPEDE